MATDENDSHSLPESWKRTTLGNVAVFINGDRGKNYPSSTDKVDSGIPFINTGHIEPNGRLSHTRMDYITKERFDLLSSGKVKKGDIVYCLRGSTIGKTARNDYHEGAIASSLAIVRAKPNTSQDYLYYFLTSPFGQQLAKENDNGSAQPNLSAKALSNYPLLLPHLDKQIAIAHILGTLDEKIELNRQMNATLEAMAQALFKSWFVDFDPVIDNALAAGNPIPEPLQTRAEARKALGDQRKPLPEGIQNQFPNRFVFNDDLGWVPEGWSRTALGDDIDLATGPAFKSKDFSDEGVRLARGDNVKEGQFHWGDKSRYWYEITPDLKKYKLAKGDILIGMDGSKVGKNWVRVTTNDLPCLLVQRVACLRPRDTIGSTFLATLIGSETFRLYVENVKTGTSIPHISAGQIKAFPVLNPNDSGKLFRDYEMQLLMSNSRREVNLSEINTLASLRDTLLPKLLSGQLRIPEAEQQVAEAL
ncbi:MAG: restriction endonuclease subunit S [Candidatus Thiodiazotropha sp.]